MTYDAFIAFLGPPIALEDVAIAAGDARSEEFVPAEPPPLAPGLTEPLPEPNPDHMHQLRLLRLE